LSFGVEEGKQILAIPAMSAPSERVFSSAANIVDKKRVRLKPENVDLLVFLRGSTAWVLPGNLSAWYTGMRVNLIRANGTLH
jgi:hypothetical protein